MSNTIRIINLLENVFNGNIELSVCEDTNTLTYSLKSSIYPNIGIDYISPIWCKEIPHAINYRKGTPANALKLAMAIIGTQPHSVYMEVLSVILSNCIKASPTHLMHSMNRILTNRGECPIDKSKLRKVNE